jgi:uncharacterized ferritin-like protein (DUF455 family)
VTATGTAFDIAQLGAPQARDDRFIVKEQWADLVNHPDGSPEHRREFLHRQMNEEANVMENAAQSLVDFPDADWGIRMWLARQCSDEARHVRYYTRMMAARGIRIGEYPVLNFQYRVLRAIDSLIGRLAVENRTFEADGLDAATFGVRESEEMGDEDMTRMLEAQQADEILHVGFANEWIRRQVAQDPRSLLKMAAALTFASRAFEAVFARGGTDVSKYPVAEAERLEAGFDQAEVRKAAEASRLRRAAVEARKQPAGGTPGA